MPQQAFEFSGVRFEPSELRLLSGGRVFPLTARAAETLLVLVRNPDSVVPKSDLLAAVWPGLAVEENNLNQQIAALRRVLAEAGATPIVTVAKRGYKLTGPVRAVSMDAMLRTGQPEQTSRRLLPLVSAVAGLALLATAASAMWSATSGSLESQAALERGDALLAQGQTRAAIAQLQRAVALDPRNARAFSVLAHALHKISSHSVVPLRPGRSPSIEAARRAVDLAPDCGACHGTLGLFLLVHGWAWADAGRHLTEAIRLEPDAEAIRPSYALWLATSGRFEEALAEIDFALQRRPYHVGWIGIRASILYLAGRYSEALAAADEALAIDDGDRGAWEWRSRALWQMGARREAISALSYGVFAEHAEPLDRAVLEGGAEAGVRLLLELTDSASLRVQHSWRRAPWRLWLGDLDGALAELEVAVATRRFNAIYLGVDPLFAGLRGDPRFTAIVERIGAGADAGEPSLQ